MARFVFLLVLIALPAVILCNEGGDHLTHADVEQVEAAYNALITEHGDCPPGEMNVPSENGTVQCGWFPKLPKIPNPVCLGIKAVCKSAGMLGC